jgi:hypothetical protein
MAVNDGVRLHLGMVLDDERRLQLATGVLDGRLDPEAMSFRDRVLLLDDGNFPEARWIAAPGKADINWRGVAEGVIKAAEAKAAANDEPRLF